MRNLLEAVMIALGLLLLKDSNNYWLNLAALILLMAGLDMRYYRRD